MLIVEGPDCVGKTTLCRKLLDRLPGWIYAHFTRLPEGFDYFWGYVDRASRRVVQDRFHMSELAYAAARGEPPRLTPESYALVDARIRLLGGLTVLVTADAGLIRGRYAAAGQMYPLDKVLTAARTFELIAGDPAGSGVDIDLYFHCDRAVPYVTDDAVDRIVDSYLARQQLVDEIAARRWGCSSAL